METTRILMVSILASSLLFTGCKKEGCTDEAALNYDSAAKKENGTCIYNNVSSQLVTVGQNEWSGDGDGYEANKFVPIITSDIASSGAVIIYLVEPSGAYLPLPMTYSNGIWVTHLLYTHGVGSVRFISYDDDGLSPTPGTLTFKVICISNNGLIQNPNVDLNNYEAVKEAFELED
jgi:hypothetical protein